MLLDELHAKKDKILSLCGQYGARRIRVFGSVSRGEERLDSDIDFLVDFPPGMIFFSNAYRWLSNCKSCWLGLLK